jgi:GPH family glycoside/pentoside/hexuronide:cation symporter
MPQLPVSKKIFYAMGGLSMNLCDMVFMQWLFVRYCPDNKPHLLPPVALGLCILGVRMIESVVGPLVGHWSDHFQSPTGRRLPFVRRSVVPLAVFFFLLWMPPESAGAFYVGVYAFCLILAYLVAYNLTVTPYLSLLPEITSDIKERVNITTLQAVFIMCSILIFATMGIILDRFGWLRVAGLVSILTVLFMLPTIFGIRETFVRPADQERLPFFRGLQLAFRNRAFFHIVISASLYWLALNSVLMLVPFWVTSYLRLSKDNVTLLMVPFLVMNMLFFFVFNYLAKRYGKYPMLLITFLVSSVLFVMMACVGLFPFGSLLGQSLVVFGLVGCVVAGFTVLPFALLSDAVDYDEQLTGRRREAVFFGFQGTFQKMGLGLSGLIFSMVAYGGEGSQISPSSLKMVAVLAGIVSFVAFLTFIKYPLRDHGGVITVKS